MTRRRTIALAIAAGGAIATFHPLCDLAFDCGCAWSGSAHCDIHQPGPPDCPVCTKPAVGAAFGAGVLVGWAALTLGVAAWLDRP